MMNKTSSKTTYSTSFAESAHAIDVRLALVADEVANLAKQQSLPTPTPAPLDELSALASEPAKHESPATDAPIDPKGRSVANGRTLLQRFVDFFRGEQSEQPVMLNRHGQSQDEQIQKPEPRAPEKKSAESPFDPNTSPITEDDKPDGAQKFDDTVLNRHRHFDADKKPGTPADETVSNPNPLDGEAPTEVSESDPNAQSRTVPVRPGDHTVDPRGDVLFSKNETEKRNPAINPVNVGTLLIAAAGIRI